MILLNSRKRRITLLIVIVCVIIIFIFGLGTTGRQYDDGTKRQAKNRITQADQRLFSFFDDPRKLNSAALPLEGTLSLGDSGGPAFLETSEGLILAGVSVGQIEGPEFSE